ncbi:MAG: sigma-54-dependent Fis family transcriptional regulator [Candidatus Dactylopiibacterium carminicum]|uniref:Sigma-54-dependent Fis family transcriptional regulator n=1 Tax=Candidatus Dactylopiibacterium carminicum TaxID=857335 RepID=A0A272ER45_9RHOO|nr:sigma-54 dependent transcriptional regulator [Candidatus Dactylopiibacterium carminicum]KAF7598671.1 sigma-54-dependent Fis family transcriptional regulator [Candidatus Dactylopiibacterium carminicum]PAS92561.1 MAG: sigma-54-dependent Fis family transcriptional regulator [Candidatus Dactylopiibacterium carminicum]PAS98539.1 MAG: sigma-54-dependent Fis family transcriptional regulator [Candidatus Dactylopiibacterium carminicum]
MIETLAILVVDDDAALRDAISLILEAAGHRVTLAASGPEALAALERQRFNLVITDLRMDPMDGLELLARIRALNPQLPVLLMTAFGDVDKAVAAMRGGACEFLMKPFESSVLLENVRRYATVTPTQEDMVAEDVRTRNVLAMAARVAETDASVLITGESGTGKEVFARYLHQHSRRKAGPFVAINCAAIPENLLEATLFGYEKGAFTGAQTAQAGKFEQAQGGTILLDEISEMPLGLQAKLLRVLQEREVERVGGKKPITLDIRVLSTSNRDMLREVQAGRFREDLFYRLNVFPLEIPSLRERPADILPLARHFIARHGERIGKTARIAGSAAEILAAWQWPGNVRELENTVQRAVILAASETISAEDVKLSLPAWQSQGAPVNLSTDIPAPLPMAGIQPLPMTQAAEALPTNMKDLEKQHILDVLKSVGGSRKKAVEKLGISERTLRYKLQQYREEGWVES